MAEPIRILIVDDHTLVRKGLRTLLEGKPGLSVIGEAADGEEAVRQAHDLKPDVILLDLVMPKKDGIAALREIVQDDPAARILVLTSFAQDEMVFSAIRGGALGYILKDSLPQELTRAIRAVYRGECSLSPSIALKVIREFDRAAPSAPAEEPLTPREVEVLRWLARGLSNREIGEKLVISERTVGVHVSHILAKLHLANRMQAALYALREGLSSLDESSIEGSM
jgi:NarL family two-component system response regulator LiaR